MIKKIISIILLVVLGATLSIGIISYVRGGLVYSWFNLETEIEDTEKDENQSETEIEDTEKDENQSETENDDEINDDEQGKEINTLIFMEEDDSINIDMLYIAPFYDSIESFENLEFTVTGVGSVILSYLEYYISSDVMKWYDSSDKYVLLDELKDELLTVELVEGNLYIEVKKFIENYYGSSSLIDGRRTIAYENKFRSYPDGITKSDCYFLIDVKDTTTELQRQFKVIVE